MSIGAKLLASLLLDGSSFTRGIDGAKKVALGFKDEISNVAGLMKGGFAMFGIQKAISTLINGLQEIKQYTKETGIEIINPEKLKYIEQATSQIRSLAMTIKGGLVEGMGDFTARIITAGKFWGKIFAGTKASDAIEEALKEMQEETPEQKAEVNKKWEDQADAQAEAHLRFKDDMLKEELRKAKEKFDQEKKDGDEAAESHLKLKDDMLKEELRKAKEKYDKEKKISKIKQNADEKIAEILDPTKNRSFVSVAPAQAAARGAYVGGVDRTGVAIQSKQLQIEQRIAAILEDMRRDVKDVMED